MYKAPPVEGLKFYFVADAGGQPLPITQHTGVTPAQIGKQFSRLKTNLIQSEEKRSNRRLTDEDANPEVQKLIAQFKKQAGEQTLGFARKQSEQRGRTRLVQPLQLIEVSLGFANGGFSEERKSVASLPAAQ